MWRFRLTRPMFLIVLTLDCLFMIVLWIMDSTHVPVKDATLPADFVIIMNIVALWRDGVS